MDNKETRANWKWILLFCLGMIVLIPLLMQQQMQKLNPTPERDWGSPENTAQQGERITILAKLQNDGFIKTWTCSPAELWVTPTFLVLDFQEKKVAAELAYAYCSNFKPGLVGPLMLRETINGKTVGRVSNSGLEMD